MNKIPILLIIIIILSPCVYLQCELNKGVCFDLLDDDDQSFSFYWALGLRLRLESMGGCVCVSVTTHRKI